MKATDCISSTFFNYVKNTIDPEIKNPCDNPALRKLFRAGKHAQIKILEKDVVDEIIFRTRNSRNRLMLELMARSGMRVGEVLKLRPIDIEDRKAIIRDPKSGKDAEVAFLPQKVPSIKNIPENIGAGSEYVMHTQTTPVIEVAGDGQTAKGVWYC